MSTATDTRALVNPFPGLRPFRHDEADLFFGRDRQSDELVGRLARKRFLAVLGTSGSGKSSLVRAGLLPSLEGGFMAKAGTHWVTATMRPQNDPVGFLARALVEARVLRQLDLPEAAASEVVETTLRRSSLGLVDVARLARLEPHENVLILVDQFEEIFRFADLAKYDGTEDEAKAFVKLVLVAAQQTDVPVYVVITMRSDFLGDCDRFPGLPEAITDSPYLTPRPTRDELQAAITGPVGVRGGRIAPRLVQRLLNDAGDDSDQLPVLQHALMRSWDHWQHDDPEARPIDLDDLEAIGGMAEALSRHAEEAYASLTSERERAIAERLFKCLTEKGTDNRELRRPTPLSQIAAITSADPAEVVSVIDVFRAPGCSFLMPPHGVELDADSVVDISHESLIRQWRRLRDWVDEEAESVRHYRRLADSAELHARGAAGVLTDPELSIILAWRDRESPNAAWAERYDVLPTPELHVALDRREENQSGFDPAMDFLAKSETAARRRRRARIAGVLGLAVLLVISAVFGLLAWKSRNEAQRQRSDAETASKAATLLALTATANDRAVTSLDSALLLSLAAYRTKPSFVSRRSVVLSREQAADEPLQLILRTHGRIAALAVSPDGSTVATADRLGHVQRWDVRSHRRSGSTLDVVNAGSHTMTNHPSVAFSPDGRHVAEGTDARLTLWDLEGHGVSLIDPEPNQIVGEVQAVAFSPNGRTLAAAGFDGHVRLWDVETHRLLARFGDEGGLPVNSLAFAPDGRTIASGGSDGRIRIWDVETGRLRRPPIEVGGRSVLALAYFGDGTLASANGAGSIDFWDAHGRKLASRISPEERAILDLALSADDARVAAALDDGTVRVWDRRTGNVLFTSPASGPTTSRTVDFDRRGRLVSSSADGAITIWRERSSSPLGVALPGRVSIPAMPRGKPDYSSLPVLAVSPDGTILVGGGDSGLLVWNARTGKPLAVSGASGAGRATALAFSADGKLLAEAVGSDIRLWRAEQLPRLVPAPAAAPVGVGATVDSLDFSRDGLLAAGDINGRVHIWAAGTPGAKPRLVGYGTDVKNDAGKRLVYAVAFNPRGTMLASGGWDGTLRLWRVRNAGDTKPIGAPDRMKTRGGNRGLAFSPDGRTVAVASSDGSISLWDAVRRTKLRETTPSGEALEKVAFAADGHILVTVGDDGAVRLLDAGTLLPLGRPLKRDVGALRSLVVSPDKSVLATAGDDRTVRLWPGILWPNMTVLTREVCNLVAGGITDAEWQRILRRVSTVAAKEPRPDLCAA